MRNDITLSILSRRAFVVSAVAAAAAGFGPLSAFAEDAGALTLERSQKFKDDFDRLVGSATPVAGRITVDLPEIAENGNFVPITIAVESPMTDTDHVTAIHLLSTANPIANVATFHLLPINAVARVASRMRLAKTQDVIVLAKLSGGDMLISTTLVKVTIGGCAS